MRDNMNETCPSVGWVGSCLCIHVGTPTVAILGRGLVEPEFNLVIQWLGPSRPSKGWDVFAICFPLATPSKKVVAGRAFGAAQAPCSRHKRWEGGIASWWSELSERIAAMQAMI
eukprot:6223370-Amphidinium_carterae.1